MRLRFGPCVFDAAARELRREGRPRPLSPKAFQFLELMLLSRPRAVSKAAIHDRLWPDTVVSDASLARLANEVRAAIGDDAREPRFVRTVHRFGYAFSGEAVPESAPSTAGSSSCRVVWADRQVALLDGENLLGRAAEARVVIDHARVSRHHARILVEGDRAVLEDLGSKNGTSLRGRRLRRPAELTDGDEIWIGRAVLVFRTTTGDSTTETGAQT